jgi:hypothetical protein
MDTSKLQQSSNAVEEAHKQEPVQSCGVADFRQVCPAVQAYGGKCDNSCDACVETEIAAIPAFTLRAAAWLLQSDTVLTVCVIKV